MLPPSASETMALRLYTRMGYEGMNGQREREGFGSLLSGMRALPPRQTACLVFLLSLLCFMALTPWVHRRWVPTGDQPHYLLATHSLLTDHDADLRNNYIQQDYAAYYPADWLDPHVKKTTSGRWYPLHDVALSILLVPAYAMGGHLGVIYFLNLIAALVAANTWWLAYELTSRRDAAWIAWLATTFSIPLLPYAFLVYPEMPAALLVLWVVRTLLRPTLAPPWRWMTAGAALLVLPWLVVRFAPIAVALSLLVVVRGAIKREFAARHWAALGIGMALMMLVILLFSSLFYHDSLAAVGSSLDRGANTLLRRLDIMNHLDSFLGWLLDQRIGLWSLAPVYLFALPGFLLLWRRRRWAALTLGGLLLVQHLSLGFTKFVMRGGIPPRYLIAVLPLAGTLLGVVWGEVRARSVRIVGGVLLALSFLNAAFVMADPLRAEFGPYDESHLLRLYSAALRVDLNRLFPLFISDMRYKDPGWDDRAEGDQDAPTYTFGGFSPALSPVGHVVPDAAATAGVATELEAGIAGIGFAGPQGSFPAGSYTLIYRLRTEGSPAPNALLAVARVEIAERPPLEREITARDLQPLGTFQQMSLPFSLDARRGVTCTLTTTGASALAVDWAGVDYAAPWRARLLALGWAGVALAFAVWVRQRGATALAAQPRETGPRGDVLPDASVTSVYHAALVVLLLIGGGLIYRQWSLLREPRIYQAEHLQRLVGQVVADPAAAGQQAVRRMGGQGAAGFLAFGPYEVFDAGGYQACFRLKSMEVGVDAEVAVVDVAAQAGEMILARRAVRAADLADTGYCDICIPFVNTAQQRLEFRVYSAAESDVWFDQVRVSRYP